MTTDRESHDTVAGLRLKKPRYGRQDYEMVAATLKQRGAIAAGYPGNGEVLAHTFRMLADDFSRTFELDNPLFNRQKFMDACGVLR